MTRQDFRRRALADLVDAERREWFHIGPVRSEIVGEQTGDDSTRSTADVYIFERIGGWSGVSADDFVRDVAGLDVEHIDLHLNSPGGDSAEGVAIANVLRQHKADITVWVDGLAASAASVIAMAGDEVVMGIGAQLMIHDAWALCVGDAAEMRKAGEMLDSTSNAIAGAYASKAGGTAAEWRAIMVAESWYTGEEAVAAKLADRVATDADKGTASGEQVVPGGSTSFWDLWDSLADADRHTDAVRALFTYAGRAEAPPPPISPAARASLEAAHPTPAASAGGSTPPQEDDDMSTLIEGLRQRLGFAENADEGTILASLDEALTQRADPPAPAAALPEGAVPIDSGVLEQLRADATAGRQAREQQQAERRGHLVQSAIDDGRITARNRQAWMTKLKVEGEGAEQDLASLAAGLVPVAERGHDTQPAAQDDLSWFDSAPTAPSNSQEG